VLARLNASAVPEDMDLPGFGLPPLTGDLKGFWSVVVSRNWQVIESGDACDVDFLLTTNEGGNLSQNASNSASSNPA
jgi:toxin HigB-1